MANFERKIDICEQIVSHVYSNRLLCAIALNTFPTVGAIQGTSQTLPRNDSMAIYGNTIVSSYLCRKWLDSGLAKGVLGLCPITPADSMLTITQANGTPSVKVFWEIIT